MKQKKRFEINNFEAQFQFLQAKNLTCLSFYKVYFNLIHKKIHRRFTQKHSTNNSQNDLEILLNILHTRSFDKNSKMLRLSLVV